ncbi:hypothetical protein JCM8547_006607 [Rhodosporidiobolus lusitaniae]
MSVTAWPTDSRETALGFGGASAGSPPSLLLEGFDLVAEESKENRTNVDPFPHPPAAAMTSLRKARSAHALSSPSSSPQLRSSTSSSTSSTSSSSAESSFFSWSRWYGAAPSSIKPPVPPLPPSDDVSRLVRAAIRRSRAIEEGESTTSSASDAELSDCSSPATSVGSKADDYLTLSPALDSGNEWGWEDAMAVKSEEVSLAASTSTRNSEPRLRSARSSATIKARPPPTGKLVRRVASRASISRDEAEVAPYSPSSPALSSSGAFSPTLSTVSGFPFPSSAVPVSPPHESTAPLPSLSLRLRRAASTATLRSINPFRLSSSTSSTVPPVPPLPPLHSPDPFAPAAFAPSVSLILRDLLLRHDSCVDPPPIPPEGVLPALPSSDSIDSLSSASSSSSRDSAEDVRRMLQRHDPYSSPSRSARPYESTDSEAEGEEDSDDPFSSSFTATAARHSSMAWISSETLPGADVPEDADEEDVFADADADSLSSARFSPSPDSPSSHFAPFDPFSLASSSLTQTSLLPSPSSSSSLSPNRPRPARILTKQRSFVDPRTRTLRTAPKVVVTPSTPERGSWVREGNGGKRLGE